MRRTSVATAAMAVVAALGGAPNAGAHSPVAAGDASSLTRLAEKANLVFVGYVADVAYRMARIQGGDGELPYTVVTYAIRDVLRGKAPERTFTMRFPGGPDGRGRFVEATGVPVFQRQEQDVLFVVGNGEKGCPLVDCEWGRFRTLEGAVYNTHGSPVRGIVKQHAIARGLPVQAFRRFSYPAPTFEGLMKNPEARRVLEEQKLGVDDARKRYEAEAPKQIEMRAIFPDTVKQGSDARATEEPSSAPPRPDATAAIPEAPEGVTLGTGPVALTEFLAAVRQAVARARRAPSALKSVDRDAEIVLRIAPRVPPTVPQAKTVAGSKTPQDEAELKALAAQDFNPVVRRH